MPPLLLPQNVENCKRAISAYCLIFFRFRQTTPTTTTSPTHVFGAATYLLARTSVETLRRYKRSWVLPVVEVYAEAGCVPLAGIQAIDTRRVPGTRHHDSIGNEQAHQTESARDARSTVTRLHGLPRFAAPRNQATCPQHPYILSKRRAGGTLQSV
jgi:hypothetical protein